MNVNGVRLMEHINTLGKIGLDGSGGRTRLAASDTNRQGRDRVVSWMKEAGLKVVVDRIGNIFGIWETEENKGRKPVMTGSHIDTVIHAGQYDGCLGVLSGIELVQTLRENGYVSSRPLVVCAFTNEEGVRYQPDMMGSLVYAGGMRAQDALAAVGSDGTVLGDELKRIGYAGSAEPGFLKPASFVELHIEQGPIMDAEGMKIGAVDNLQGIHWHKVTVQGAQNHAGTTPLPLRRDAGLAAAKINVKARELAEQYGGVATVGTMRFLPNAVNVIPERADFTVDIRNPDKEKLESSEAALFEYYKELEKTDHVKITFQQMTHFDPVPFDGEICGMIEEAARARHLSTRRMVSGAGQDSQMMARICRTAMIFVPSVNGISHSPEEYTPDEDCVNGANVLLDVVTRLSAG